MDYAEEQNNEIEALESIYCDEFETISVEPPVFSIFIRTENYEEKLNETNKKNKNYNDTNEDDNVIIEGICCRLQFEYTPKYPEEPPIFRIEDSKNLNCEDEEELTSHLQQMAVENVGMAMIFTLVSTTQEWISARSDLIKKNKEEAAIKKKYEEEEAERQKFEGTRVTVESFLAWKLAFESEMGLDKKREKEEKNKKITGKELFMQDKSLNESDLKFLEEGGEVVKVDESLFQDLDDLEINDELSEDDD